MMDKTFMKNSCVFQTTPDHRRDTNGDWNSVFQAAVNVTPLWDNSG